MNQSSRTLRSEDMIETIFLNIEVQYREQGGTARVIFFEDGDRPRLASRRYVVDLGGEAIDELIAALEPCLTSHICNWDHTWVRVPNPKHRPGE